MTLYCPTPGCKAQGAILLKNAPIVDPERPPLTIRCAKCGSDVEIRVETRVVRKGMVVNQIAKVKEKPL